MRSPFPLSPLQLSHAAGSWLYDTDGRRYFDGSSGSICVNVGHRNHHVLAALAQQGDRVAFATPGNWTSEHASELAFRLTSYVERPESSVMLSTTGTAANELAIHLSRQYQRERGEHSRSLILTSWLGFHGCSELTLALSGHPRRRPNLVDRHGLMPTFDPPYPGYHPHGSNTAQCGAACASAVADAIDRVGAENVAAVLIEPINGATGGGYVPPAGYLARLREICSDRGVLVIHDEVMVGLGRAGPALAADLFPDAEPDFSVVSKGLGAGYATISAVLSHGEAGKWFGSEPVRRLPLESTMAGAPLQVAVGLGVLDALEELDTIGGGQEFYAAARQVCTDIACVRDVRGAGYFVGVELTPGCLLEALEATRRAGVVLYPFGAPDSSCSGIFLAPPLTAAPLELAHMLDAVSGALSSIERVSS
jgi:taurine--2-oxoglutarate transaminase